MRVLVVEDHQVLATAIGAGLRRESMAVDVVLDGNEALEYLAVIRLRNREPFDLAEVTERIVRARAQDAARRGVRVDTRLAPAIAAGDPNLAESLVANLVDNAIRHNVAGGKVQIATTVAAGSACLSVSNTGAVIPPGEVGRLFQPFQQLAGERTGERTRHGGGHGLGLAIVRAIASARRRARRQGQARWRPRHHGGLPRSGALSLNSERSYLGLRAKPQ
jgi:signal transduction histidine kinase